MSSIGRYEIHGEIASGGMARVHFGRLRGDQGFQRVVAIKRMHPKLARDPKFVTMFRDEALLASRIRHPNVVTTLDVVESGGEVVIVMEYVRGLPLSILLARANRAQEDVPAPVAVAILCGVLAGLHAAHEARGVDGAPLSIVHRDVSPQNVLVDVDGVARVVDFGIAKASSQLHVTIEGELKGKLAFMAPEQILSRPIDRRVDVFAAGVVAHSMLTGSSLFSQGEVDQIRDRVLHMSIPRLTVRRPDVGEALADAIARALQRDPQARFATAREFENAVELAFDRPASARQLGAWVERLGKDVLAERDREVARIEVGTTTPAEPGEGPLEITSTDAPTVEIMAEPAARTALEPASARAAAAEAPPAAEPAPAAGADAEKTGPSVVSDVGRAAARRPGTLTLLAGAATAAAAVAVALWFATTDAPTAAPPADRTATSASASGAPAATADDPPANPSPPTAAVPSALPSVLEPSGRADASSSTNAPGSALPGGIRKTPGYFPARP